MIDIKKIMNSPITIEGEKSLGDGISKMLKDKINRLLITKEGKISKIISQKDICQFLLKKPNESINKIPLQSISKELLSIEETENIESCAKLMISNNIGSLGIKSERVIGIITKTDLLKIIQDELKGKKSAVEIMSNDYLWEFSKEPINKIFKKMFEYNISRLILKDENEISSGIITTSDLLKLGFRDFDTTSAEKTKLDTDLLYDRLNSGEISGEQISTKKILSVPMKEDISKICTLLLNQKINGLGVLNDNNIIWGILTKTDIVKAFISK